MGARALSAPVLDPPFLCHIRELESEHAVFDSVQLDASTTKGCKSIRLLIILPIVRLNVYVQR